MADRSIVMLKIRICRFSLLFCYVIYPLFSQRGWTAAQAGTCRRGAMRVLSACPSLCILDKVDVAVALPHGLRAAYDAFCPFFASQHPTSIVSSLDPSLDAGMSCSWPSTSGRRIDMHSVPLTGASGSSPFLPGCTCSHSTRDRVPLWHVASLRMFVLHRTDPRRPHGS